VNGCGAPQDEMRLFSRLSDRETDAILAGNAPAEGGEELQELAAFFRDARVLLAEPPAPAIAAAHLAAIAEAAPRNDARASEPQAPVWPRQRTRRVPLGLPMRVAAAVAGLALLSALAGAAYAGALPEPVQRQVADIARRVGLSLPGYKNDVHQGDAGNHDHGSQGRRGGDQGSKHQGSQGSTDPRLQGNVDQGADNQKGEGARGNADGGAQANVNEGARGNVDGGPQANVNEGARGNVDEGAQNANDEGAQGNIDEGAPSHTDEGAQGDRSGGPPGGGNSGEGDGGNG